MNSAEIAFLFIYFLIMKACLWKGSSLSYLSIYLLKGRFQSNWGRSSKNISAQCLFQSSEKANDHNVCVLFLFLRQSPSIYMLSIFFFQRYMQSVFFCVVLWKIHNRPSLSLLVLPQVSCLMLSSHRRQVIIDDNLYFNSLILVSFK